MEFLFFKFKEIATTQHSYINIWLHPSGALKENVIEEGETKKEFTKRKRDERKKDKIDFKRRKVTRTICRENQEHCTQVFMKVYTEGMLFSAQEQALRTNLIKAKIDKEPVFPKCRLCGTKEDTVMLQAGTQTVKRRHDNVARRVHWELCIHLLMSWRMMEYNCTGILLSRQT